MIAMQYGFTLPADYDMAIVDRRIATKGPLLDNLPGLRFKAYLTARRQGGAVPGRENLYAPFYLWNDAAAASDFLCGAGFVGLTEAFGWPAVRTWIVWRAELAADLLADRTLAAFATRALTRTPPYAPLGEVRQRESEAVAEDVARGGALASVAAFEPTTWTRVHFRLWPQAPAVVGDDVAGEHVQVYEVGHLSLPAA